ncbi:MAG: hypothetical protein K1Y36_02200 [Blastocatellia bacterium]|nr:hypothetical protein [Blastocatellia bacterium]
MKSVVDIHAAKYDLELALLHLEQHTQTKGEPIRAFWRGTGSHRPPETLARDRISVSVEFGKVILCLFGEERAESWRVKEYAILPDRLTLNLERQAGKVSASLTLTGGEQLPLPVSVTERRNEFSLQFETLLKRFFPGWKGRHPHIRKESARLSRYVWAELERQGKILLAFGINPDELQPAVNGILSEALETEAALRAKGRDICRVCLFVPEHQSITLAERLRLVTAPCPELYEMDAAGTRARRIEPAEQPALVTGPASRYIWPKPVGTLTSTETRLVEKVVTQAPEMIDVTLPLRSRQLVFRWLGLEFARLRRETALRPPAMTVGIPGIDHLFWLDSTQPHQQLETMIGQLRKFRTAEPADRTNWLYRTQSERWLEALVRRNPAVLDVELDPAFAYAQAPAYDLNEAGYVDVLARTHTGRLAVMELKTTADRELPWQGLDYWRRVQAHARRGDFTRRGFFAGAEMDFSAPPLLYLVAPVLRRHETLRLMCRRMNPAVPVRVLGLSEHWRQELRVIVRE